MKHTSLNTPTEPAAWPMFALAILLAVLSALSVFVAITTTSGCAADPVIPITPEPGLPCGRIYHQCPSGGCCGEDEVCRAGGYCAYVGGPGSTWGASRDGGAAERRQLSPEDARKAAPR